MGALFSLNALRNMMILKAYRAAYPAHALYPFMLDGATELEQAVKGAKTPWALVFGNEGAGLPPAFAALGQAVKIRQSDAVDSLNLAVSAAIGMYRFTQEAHNGTSGDL